MKASKTIRVLETLTLTHKEATERFMVDCYTRNLSPSTIVQNELVLRYFEIFCKDLILYEIEPHTIRKYILEKSKTVKNTTVSRYCTVLKSYFKFLFQEGILSNNPMDNITKPKVPMTIIEPLSSEEVSRLLIACGKTFVGIRNKLIISMLYDCGFRASELCDLKITDVDMSNQSIIIRHGKNDKSRIVPFGKNTKALLTDYLIKRKDVDNQSLIINIYAKSVTRDFLGFVIEDTARKAGFPDKRVHPHLLRHSMAVGYLRSGGDVFSLQKILGHSTLDMTRHYSQLADSDVQEKHKLYSPMDNLFGKMQHGRTQLK